MAHSAVAPRCPFEVLGVAPGTVLKELRQAYLDQARRYHPDKNRGGTPEELAAAQKSFIEVQDAWEGLQAAGFEEDRGAPVAVSKETDLAKRIEVLEEQLERLRECQVFADERVFVLQSAVGVFKDQEKEVVPGEWSFSRQGWMPKPARITKKEAAARAKAEMKASLLGTGSKKKTEFHLDVVVNIRIAHQFDELAKLNYSCRKQQTCISDQVFTTENSLEQARSELEMERTLEAKAKRQQEESEKAPKAATKPVEYVPMQSGFFSEMVEDLASAPSYFFTTAWDVFSSPFAAAPSGTPAWVVTPNPEMPLPCAKQMEHMGLPDAERMKEYEKKDDGAVLCLQDGSKL